MTTPLSEHLIPANDLVAYLQDRITRAEGLAQQYADAAHNDAQTPESARYWTNQGNEQANQADTCRGILRAVVQGLI